MSPLRVAGDGAEMAAWMAVFRAAEYGLTLRQMLRLLRRALALPGGARTGAGAGDPRGEARRAVAWVQRAKRLVPQTRCLHHAFAARVWLARRGVRARVVIGMRRGTASAEGHAWLELEDGSVLFPGEGAAYTPVLREDS